MDDQWPQFVSSAGAALTQRRFRDAVVALDRAITLRPDHADSWFNLGYALRQIRNYPRALEAYAEALRRGVTGAEAAHVNRAAILSEYLDQTNAAETELRSAIARNPQFLPAWLNLGGLMEDAGRADAAADAYERALQMAPGNGRARARLAAIQVHRGDTNRAIGELEAQLRRGADSHDDMAEMLFALGNSLDAAGRYAEAFAAISQANGINAALRAPTQRYDRKAQERLTDALVETFAVAPDTTDSDAGANMIFVCGMFRSGSTVFEQLLGRHPLVEVGGELELIPALVHEHLLPYPDAVRNIDSDRLQMLREQYLQTIAANFPAATYVTDKRPDNFLHIGLIKTLFPHARIILTERDPLDNLLSLYFLNFAETINYSDALDDIVHYLGQYRRLADHWQAVFGPDIVTVDYDRLVRAPDAVMIDVLAGLKLPVGSADAAVDAAAPIIRTPSNWKARSAINPQSSGRWRNYSTELAAARAMLNDMRG